MDATPLEGGFDDVPRAASFAFRAVMTAMAHPGRIEPLTGARPSAPLSVAAGTLLLTLVDNDTPVHLAGAYDTLSIRQWLAFHTGAFFVGPDKAVFAVGRWDDLLPLEAYPVGTPEYPDRSATLIVDDMDFEAGATSLTGPGIKTKVRMALPDADRLAANNRMFPLGLDFFFTSGSRVAALPRSTRIG